MCTARLRRVKNGRPRVMKRVEACVGYGHLSEPQTCTGPERGGERGVEHRGGIEEEAAHRVSFPVGDVEPGVYLACQDRRRHREWALEGPRPECEHICATHSGWFGFTLTTHGQALKYASTESGPTKKIARNDITASVHAPIPCLRYGRRPRIVRDGYFGPVIRPCTASTRR
jgi:hypothetical protein